MRRTLAIVFLLLSAAISSVQASSNDLVKYSFDDELIDTGPDTFAVFQNASGTVRLVSDIRYSGYRSIELRDAIKDGDFPELQGYFPERASGLLFFHFAMLVANPEQTLNIALAGPNHFNLGENGIAFWLKTRNGTLCHVSDSIPKKLFALKPFSWYLVDLRYDIGAGRYDLRIGEEGVAAPIVDLHDQPNAANAPGSSVNKFSFVGDVEEDRSKVTYYVDDVIIGTDAEIVLGPLVAPGRRKLFIDRWHDTQKLLAASPRCAEPLSMADFGLNDSDIAELERLGGLPYLRSLIDGTIRALPEEVLPRVRSILAPLVEWGSACRVMERDALKAAHAFAAAAKRYPAVTIFPIAELQSYVRAGRRAEAEERWISLEPILRNDPRYGMLAALMGIHRNDWSEAEAWLRLPAEKLAEDFRADGVRQFWVEGGQRGVEALQSALPNGWRNHIEQRLIADQYYFVLLWKSEFDRAARFAHRMAERLETFGADSTIWLERTGDALFLAGAPSEAQRFYQEVLGHTPDSWGATTKLSDVHFRLGNLDQERKYREKMFGSLNR